MFHVPPGMTEHQLVLVLDVCKTMRAHIKIRKKLVLVVNLHKSKHPQNLTPQILVWTVILFNQKCYKQSFLFILLFRL